MKKVVFVHLYNDYSGSPRVLATVIQGLQKKGMQAEVITSSGPGFLSDLEGVTRHSIPYEFANSTWLRLYRLFVNQLLVFLRIWHYRREDVTVYINTLLPFGAAVAAFLLGKPVVYHMHETSLQPTFKKFLRLVARLTATHCIYVSQYLQAQEAIPGVPATVVYNALSASFVQKAKAHYSTTLPKCSDFVVLMLCSLKSYKGVDDFIELAQQLPNYSFELVVNASRKQVEEYFSTIHLPPNIIVFSAQKNVDQFYQRAKLVLNLSHPDRWVETFGLTLLEGMQYGIPVIGPPVGGPAELIESDVCGFSTHHLEKKTLKDQIQILANDPMKYQQFSRQAFQRADQFSAKKMIDQIEALLSCRMKLTSLSLT